MNDLNRFIESQNLIYETVLFELKNGKKKSHWMWYIFPQLKGLGYSYKSYFYGIKDLNEARNYLQNDTLKSRYNECCNILFELEKKDINLIFDSIDCLKLRSSLTLFILCNTISNALPLNVFFAYSILIPLLYSVYIKNKSKQCINITCFENIIKNR